MTELEAAPESSPTLRLALAKGALVSLLIVGALVALVFRAPSPLAPRPRPRLHAPIVLDELVRQGPSDGADAPAPGVQVRIQER